MTTTYFIQAEFKISCYYPLPDTLCLCDLEDTNIVKSYGVKWNTLYIYYADGRIDEIKPKIDPDYDNFFKRPEQYYPIAKVDDELYCDEQVHSCDCQLPTLCGNCKTNPISGRALAFNDWCRACDFSLWTTQFDDGEFISPLLNPEPKPNQTLEALEALYNEKIMELI